MTPPEPTPEARTTAEQRLHDLRLELYYYTERRQNTLTEIRQTVLTAIRLGTPKKHAAQLGGITRSTVYTWLKEEGHPDV